jgi:hypothetical protein
MRRDTGDASTFANERVVFYSPNPNPNFLTLFIEDEDTESEPHIALFLEQPLSW